MTLYRNWLVLGPMRSGSWGVVRGLSKYKPYQIFYYSHPGISPHQLRRHEIVHTHNLNWLQFVTETTGVVFTVRNPIQCALSKCIMPKLGTRNNQPIWHFNPGDEQQIDDISKNIEPFYLDIEQFKQEVDVADDFYKKIMQWPQWINYPIIEYESWQSDPSLILAQLGLEHFTPPWPLKNPGSPKQWIKNFDEIMDYSRSLSLENYLQICQRK